MPIPPNRVSLERERKREKSKKGIICSYYDLFSVSLEFSANKKLQCFASYYAKYKRWERVRERERKRKTRQSEVKKLDHFFIFLISFDCKLVPHAIANAFS